jgi:hypothetical protein
MGLVELFRGMVISGIAIGVVSLGAGVYFEFFRSKKYEYPRERLTAKLLLLLLLTCLPAFQAPS